MPDQITDEQLKNMSPEQIAELQKQNCIFCKIINGEIPSKRVYEDEHCFCILDINPATEGHVLILPKEHYSIMPQMPQDIVSHMFIVAKNISQAILKAFGAKGTSIFVANGQPAGQKAPHFMIHVFQRAEGDGIFQNPEVSLSSEDLTKLKAYLQPKIYTMHGKELKVEGDSSDMLDHDIDDGLVKALSEMEKPKPPEGIEPGESKEEQESGDTSEDEPPNVEPHSDDLVDTINSDNLNSNHSPESFASEEDLDNEDTDLDKISELFK